MQIRTAAEALHAAGRTYSARNVEPITNDNGQLIGWTFATSPSGYTNCGWVLTDGRVSPALETYRADAEQYARNSH